MRDGQAEIAVGSTELRPGDQVLGDPPAGQGRRAAAGAAQDVEARASGSCVARRSRQRCPARRAARAGAQAQLALRPVVRGLDSPVYVTAAPRASRGRLYVVEQAGRDPRASSNGKLRAKPFLDIRSRVVAGGEQGLLSVAFHPSYATNHRFYVDYTDRNGDTRVVEYRSNGTAALPRPRASCSSSTSRTRTTTAASSSSARTASSTSAWATAAPAATRRTARRTSASRLGKLLRDQRGHGAARAGRSRATACATRGASRSTARRRPLHRRRRPERVGGDRLRTPRSAARARELRLGRLRGHARASRASEPNPRGHARHADRRVQPRARLLGHRRLRLPRQGVPSLRGRYFYGDYCTGTSGACSASRGKLTRVAARAVPVANLSSFGEDARGELYAISLDGDVYKLTS